MIYNKHISELLSGNVGTSVAGPGSVSVMNLLFRENQKMFGTKWIDGGIDVAAPFMQNFKLVL